MNAKQDELTPNPRMVALWRTLIDMERTWKGFSPLPDLNKSLFGVMMCIAHGGKSGAVPQRLKEEDEAQHACAARQTSSAQSDAQASDCTHPAAKRKTAKPSPASQKLPEKPVAVGAIATQLSQSLSAISQKISALEELGYVTRMADPDDRRVTCVALTDIGAQKLREGRERFEAKLNAALDAMGDARMQQLLSLLGELNEALKQTVASNPQK